jgi:alpha-galactosidase
MVDEMWVAQARWLPQYAEFIPGAKDRLARASVKTREWTGAARRDVRSVEELQLLHLDATGAAAREAEAH